MVVVALIPAVVVATGTVLEAVMIAVDEVALGR
jgi:hypothetical protein